MVLTRLLGASVVGIGALVVEVEVDLSRGGLPGMVIVGLPDAAVKESRDRVRLAVRNAGYRFPARRITVNLAPAEEKKSGGLDLPMALAILAASDVFDVRSLEGLAAVGELSLSGEVRPIRGALAVAEVLARRGDVKRLLVPAGCAGEAALVGGEMDVIGVGSLSEAVGVLTGELSIAPTRVDLERLFEVSRSDEEGDLGDVRGQELAKRALLVAAAGRHGVLFCGPPGSGKSMLARRLVGISPPLGLGEALEVTRVYSICGLLEEGQALVSRRPFRAPHHSISDAGLVGGGSGPRPGEISLAHCGVLFLDELPEFSRRVLELLREPLESRSVVISRARGSQRFPANFQFIAAMNPCPCGYYGGRGGRCRCSDVMVKRYQGRISGPLLDRIDLRVDVEPVTFDELAGVRGGGMSSEEALERVVAARSVQVERLGEGRANGDMSEAEVEEYCPLSEECYGLLKNASERLNLSARGICRARKVARSVADLEGSERIEVKHLLETLAWRTSGG